MKITLSLCWNFYSQFWFGAPALSVGDSMYTGLTVIEKLRELTTNRRVLLLICGFNNNFDNAERAYDTVEANLRNFGMLADNGIGDYDVMIRIFWPGQSVAGFGLAQLSARKAGQKLHDIFTQLSVLSLDIETHSLGAEVGLKINEKGDIFVRNYILTSPAVGCDVLAGKYHLAVANVLHCLVCWSRNDGTLGRWYSDWERLLWKFRTQASSALGYTGAEDLTKCPASVTQWDASDLVKQHSAWKDLPQFYSTWIGSLFPRKAS